MFHERGNMPSTSKVAIVTGGGTGVGRSTSLALARLGYHVVINYSRSKDEALKTISEIQEHGVQGFAAEGFFQVGA